MPMNMSGNDGLMAKKEIYGYDVRFGIYPLSVFFFFFFLFFLPILFILLLHIGV